MPARDCQDQLELGRALTLLGEWFPGLRSDDSQDQLELEGALTLLGEWFPEGGLWINSLNITLDLDRNANSPTLPKTY